MDFLDRGHGLICCIFLAGWTELYHDHPEHANQGNEHDPAAPDHLGAFYLRPSWVYFPSRCFFPVLSYYCSTGMPERVFIYPIYLSAATQKALPNEGGSPILFQHLFWFLGHPEVYIIILPAMGLVSEVMAINSRKPIFGYMAMVGSLFAITILAFLVWAHHMFVTGLNPFLGSVFVLLTLLIAVPSAIKVFNWLTTLWRGNIRFTPAMLFAIGFVSMFISGGLTGIFLGNSTLDIHLHDTMFVVAHFHIVMGVSAFFGMFCGIYHWFPKMYGRYLNNTMSYIHFWVTFAGAYLIFWPMHYEGLAGMPRRYVDYSGWTSFNQFGDLNRFISTVAMVVFAVQLMFVFNFFYSIFKGRKVTTRIHGRPTPWNGRHRSVRVMVTGREKFLKFTAGLTTMARTEKNSSCKQNHLEPMNSTISSGDKPYHLMEQETIKQSGSFKIAES